MKYVGIKELQKSGRIRDLRKTKYVGIVKHEHGFDLEVLTPVCTSREGVLKQLEKMARGPEGVLILPVDPTAVRPLQEEVDGIELGTRVRIQGDVVVLRAG